MFKSLGTAKIQVSQIVVKEETEYVSPGSGII